MLYPHEIAHITRNSIAQRQPFRFLSAHFCPGRVVSEADQTDRLVLVEEGGPG